MKLPIRGYLGATLRKDHQFNLEFQFKSVFNLEWSINVYILSYKIRKIEGTKLGPSRRGGGLFKVCTGLVVLFLLTHLNNLETVP